MLIVLIVILSTLSVEWRAVRLFVICADEINQQHFFKWMVRKAPFMLK